MTLSCPHPRRFNAATLLSCAAAALVGPIAGHAQQAAQQIAPPTAQAEPQSPPPGSSYKAETHGAWSRLCTVNAEGDDPCELYQLLKDGRGASVAEITIVDLLAPAQGQAGTAVAGAMLITPLETYLPAQIRIKVDDNPDAIYRFEYCSQVGCVARIGFTAEEVSAFRRGKVARVTIAAAADPTRPVELEMSLSGFTAGFAAVQKANANLRN